MARTIKKPELQPRIRLQMGEEIALGPGKAALLDAIGLTGSISAAARSMGMSYRRAWLLVDTMNAVFRTPLVETSAGGKAGGGASLTPLGRDVLKRYRKLEQATLRAVKREFGALIKK